MPETRAEAASNPGIYLRGIREQRGLSLHQVAVELHVSDSILESLERGDYAVLGGAVFVRGHLRNYARALGIADTEVLSLYDQGENKPAVPTLITQHVGGVSARAREWTMRGATAAVTLVLLMLAVSWWLRRPEEVAQPNASQVTAESVSAPSGSTVPTAVALPGKQAPAQPSISPQALPLAPMPTQASRSTPRPVRAGHTHAVDVVKVAPAQTLPQVNHPHQVTNLTHAQFTLSAPSWVEVYDAGGKRLYYDLAPAGQMFDVSGAGPLQVFLGNAPGVSIELNGAPFDIKSYSRADNTARFTLGASSGAGH